MTKLLHSKRLVPFIVKTYDFTERNSSKDFALQKQALADVCKIDIPKDFSKFAGKHLCQILYLKLVSAIFYQIFISH